MVFLHKLQIYLNFFHLNLLQEKKLNDTQALLWNQRGLDRANELIKEIEEDIK